MKRQQQRRTKPLYSIGMVEVTGIDRKKLLRALWDNAEPSSYWQTRKDLESPSFDMRTIEEDEEIKDGYADYVCGRWIRVKIFPARKWVDPSLYDLEYGQGAFKKVVDGLRKE